MIKNRIRSFVAIIGVVTSAVLLVTANPAVAATARSSSAATVDTVATAATVGVEGSSIGVTAISDVIYSEFGKFGYSPTPTGVMAVMMANCLTRLNPNFYDPQLDRKGLFALTPWAWDTFKKDHMQNPYDPQQNAWTLAHFFYANNSKWQRVDPACAIQLGFS